MATEIEAAFDVEGLVAELTNRKYTGNCDSGCAHEVNDAIDMCVTIIRAHSAKRSPTEDALAEAKRILATFKTEGNRTKAEEWEAAYAMLFTQMTELVEENRRLKAIKEPAPDAGVDARFSSYRTFWKSWRNQSSMVKRESDRWMLGFMERYINEVSGGSPSTNRYPDEIDAFFDKPIAAMPAAGEVGRLTAKAREALKWLSMGQPGEAEDILCEAVGEPYKAKAALGKGE